MPDADPERTGIAERLRAAREQAGLSQGQVAKIFGYQRPTISEIEAGRRRVVADELPKFAEIYDVTVSWLTRTDSELDDPAVELAARELAKLKPDDFSRVMKLLQSLRRAESKKK